MEFTQMADKEVDRQEFLEDVRMVEPATTEKEVVRQSDCVAFTQGFVFGYDDELCIAHPVDIDFEGAVRAGELRKLLGKINHKTIKVSGKSDSLVITYGKDKKAEFSVEEVEMPLDEIDIPEQEEWEELPANFNECIKFVMFSASTDYSKPLLTCIHVNSDYAEASDDSRICKMWMVDESPEMLIPAGAARQIIKYKPTHTVVTDTWLYFSNEEGTILCCRTFGDEKFPDLESRIPEKGKQVEMPEDMQDSLERSKIFTNAAVERDQVVICTLEKNKFTLHAESEAGNITEPLDISYDGEKVQFGAHPEFLSDALLLMNTAEINEDHLILRGDDFVHLVCLEEVE